MKLEKNFATKLLDFLTNEFNSGYNTPTQKNYISYMERSFKDGFKTEWSLGGTHGNCYGEKTEASAEIETDLTQLDDFIMSQYPNITFMQYKMIERAISKNITNDSDWYGGETQKASKEISFSTLSDVAIKVKLEEDNEYVNTDELIVQKALELFPEKVKAKAVKAEENPEITAFAASLAQGLKPKKALGIADEKKIRKPKEVTEKVAKAPKKKM